MSCKAIAITSQSGFFVFLQEVNDIIVLNDRVKEYNENKKYTDNNLDLQLQKDEFFLIDFSPLSHP
jgi:high-affinity nickel permease